MSSYMQYETYEELLIVRPFNPSILIDFYDIMGDVDFSQFVATWQMEPM